MSGKSRIDGQVRDIVSSGDAVVETKAGIVFARGGLPGEHVSVLLDGKAGRIQRGRVVSVREPSPARVEPPCPYVERCGGCSLMHAELAAQRAFTSGFLRTALLKAGAPAPLEVAETPSEHALGYRRRARLAFRRAKERTVLGFRRERSHDVVDIDRCLVLSDPLQAALTRLRELVTSELHGEGELSLALGQGGLAVAVLRSSEPQPPALYAACERAVDGQVIEGLALFAAGATKPATFGDAREWSHDLTGVPLEGPIGGFSQANAEVNRALVTRVVELARCEGMRVLELYAGAGNFSVALAPGSLGYTAVEQAPAAVEALRKNLASRGLSAKVLEGDVSKNLGTGPLDVVVLDPPRTGAPGVLAALAQRKPKRIVYVSCDPATLARDVGELLTRGYALRHVEAFQMFPQTADLESVVLLERQS